MSPLYLQTAVCIYLRSYSCSSLCYGRFRYSFNLPLIFRIRRALFFSRSPGKISCFLPKTDCFQKKKLAGKAMNTEEGVRREEATGHGRRTSSPYILLGSLRYEAKPQLAACCEYVPIPDDQKRDNVKTTRTHTICYSESGRPGTADDTLSVPALSVFISHSSSCRGVSR